MRLKLLGFLFALGMILPSVAWAQDGDDVVRPVAPPDDVNLPIADVIYEADFSNSDFWRAGEAPDGQISFAPTDDGFSVVSLPSEGGIGSLPLINLNVDDFYTEISFRVETCSSDSSALLFFTRVLPSTTQSQSNDTFVYVLQCSGDFRARSLAGGEIGDVVVSGQTLPLNEGETYTFGILMAGSSVAWYLNQQEVAQFEILDGELRSSGSLTPGAQVGLAYTLTSWRVWSLKSTGSNIEDVTIIETPSEDPIASGSLGDVIYEPSFVPPTSIPLGLHHDVAAYLVGGGRSINLYNTRRPFGVLAFDGVDAANYYLEIEFTIRECGDTSGVGFVWRADADLLNYYAFYIQCDGVFRAYAVVDGVAGEAFVSGRLGDALTDITGSILLGVLVDGDTAYMYGGDTQFASFSDSTFTSGGAGLLLSSDEETGRPMDINVTGLSAFDVP